MNDPLYQRLKYKFVTIYKNFWFHVSKIQIYRFLL